jgi:hypothetical protein
VLAHCPQNPVRFGNFVFRGSAVRRNPVRFGISLFRTLEGEGRVCAGGLLPERGRSFHRGGIVAGDLGFWTGDGGNGLEVTENKLNIYLGRRGTPRRLGRIRCSTPPAWSGRDRYPRPCALESRRQRERPRQRPLRRPRVRPGRSLPPRTTGLTADLPARA